MLADPETADWTRDKGEANGQRELHRIWEAGGRVGWLDNAQTDRNSEPRPNLFNVMLALREDPRLAELLRVRRNAADAHAGVGSARRSHVGAVRTAPRAR